MLDRTAPLRLGALFTALLAACSGRPLTGESESGSGTGETTEAPGPTTGSTDPTGTGSPTSTGDPTTGAPMTTLEPDSGYEPPVCEYETHLITLTPEEYAHWLEHGEPPPGDTTGGTGDTGGDPGGTTSGPEDSASGSAGDTTGAPVDTTGGTGGTGETGGAEWGFDLCAKICAHFHPDVYEITSCEKTADSDDATGIEIACEELVSACDGRSHACIRSRGAADGDDPVGAWYARVTHDEAASVHAFIALGRELADHGAPAELLARVRAAADDEVRHARATAALARRHGGQLRRPRHAPASPRSLRAIAVENAVEGCVRETWAALSAAHQARHAADPEIRAAMQAIADDEARHAELAWALGAWLEGQLDADARAAVERARREAADALIRHLAAQPRDPALVRRAGVPDHRAAARLAAGLAQALWPAAA